MHRIAGCSLLFFIWGMLFAGIAPGPAPAGRAVVGVPISVPPPGYGTLPFLASPVPFDTLPPAEVDTVYTAGHERIQDYRGYLVLGALGMGLGSLWLANTPFLFFGLILLLIITLLIAVLLPKLLGKERIRQIGARIIIRRLARKRNQTRPIPQGLSDEQVQIWKKFRNFRLFMVIAMGCIVIGSLLLLLFGFFSVLFVYSTFTLILIGMSIFFVSMLDAHIWTRRYGHHRPNRVLRVAQSATLIAAISSFSVLAIVAIFPELMLLLLIIPTIFLIWCIITFVRVIQLFKTVSNH